MTFPLSKYTTSELLGLKHLIYIYPVTKRLSFSLIAKEHIARLKRTIQVHEVDEEVLDMFFWTSGKNILLHPILYVTIGDRKEMFNARIKRLHNLLKVKHLLGGFDTCDSDQISNIAVEVLNHFDLIIVPSTFAKKVYRSCGVKAHIEVLPHGLPDAFLGPAFQEVTPAIFDLLQLKKQHNMKLVLFFLQHSGFRKGADIVYKAFKQIQERRKDIVLVVKRGEIEDPFIHPLRSLKMVEIAGFMSWKELASLYDAVDIVVVPSRGGGFELNALEAIARGKPTIAPNAGCFMDYAKYLVTLERLSKVKVFPDNPIHVGYGFQADPQELAEKIIEICDHYYEYSTQAQRNSVKVKLNYSWDKVCSKLISILQRRGFI